MQCKLGNYGSSIRGGDKKGGGHGREEALMGGRGEEERVGKRGYGHRKGH